MEYDGYDDSPEEFCEGPAVDDIVTGMEIVRPNTGSRVSLCQATLNNLRVGMIETFMEGYPGWVPTRFYTEG